MSMIRLVFTVVINNQSYDSFHLYLLIYRYPQLPCLLGAPPHSCVASYQSKINWRSFRCFYKGKPSTGTTRSRRYKEEHVSQNSPSYFVHRCWITCWTLKPLSQEFNVQMRRYATTCLQCKSWVNVSPSLTMRCWRAWSSVVSCLKSKGEREEVLNGTSAQKQAIQCHSR